MDLHDGLGQELFGLGMHVRSLADRLAAEGSAHSGAADRIVALVDEALASARGMAHGLNPVDASPHGLGDALHRLCRAARETAPDLTVTCNAEPVVLADRRDARHLYRIAQEALSNAVQHADAQTVVVTLHSSPSSGSGPAIHLEVRDDGSGIGDDVLAAERDGLASAESRAALARRGMGIYSMRHRADLIGADLTVARADEGGTVVRCVLTPHGRDREASRSRRGELE